MSDESKGKTERAPQASTWMALGTAFGVAFGSAFGRIGEGLVLGPVFGLVFGCWLDAQANKRAGAEAEDA